MNRQTYNTPSDGKEMTGIAESWLTKKAAGAVLDYGTKETLRWLEQRGNFNYREKTLTFEIISVLLFADPPRMIEFDSWFSEVLDRKFKIQTKARESLIAYEMHKYGFAYRAESDPLLDAYFMKEEDEIREDIVVEESEFRLNKLVLYCIPAIGTKESVASSLVSALRLLDAIKGEITIPFTCQRSSTEFRIVGQKGALTELSKKVSKSFKGSSSLEEEIEGKAWLSYRNVDSLALFQISKSFISWPRIILSRISGVGSNGDVQTSPS
jgi:hypothetical protein